MNRREFIKLAAYAGMGTLLLPGCGAQVSEPAPAGPKKRRDSGGAMAKDLIVVQGSDPEEMLKRGMRALGGIQTFVKPGDKVVLKPNFSVPMLPEQACTTNPVLVASLVKLCLEAGAQEVKVIDHTLTNPVICLEKTGMKASVSAAGGKVYTLNDDPKRFFTPVKINGKALAKTDYSLDALAADVFINMPILKHHYITNVTLGLKNLMGLVWNRYDFHVSDLDRCIAELAAFMKPSLTIMDAIRGITDNGPRGPGPIKEYNQVVFGVDPVAVDAYGAALFGVKPAEIRHFCHAAEMGVGRIDWEKLNVRRV